MGNIPKKSINNIDADLLYTQLRQNNVVVHQEAGIQAKTVRGVGITYHALVMILPPEISKRQVDTLLNQALCYQPVQSSPALILTEIEYDNFYYPWWWHVNDTQWILYLPIDEQCKIHIRSDFASALLQLRTNANKHHASKYRWCAIFVLGVLVTLSVIAAALFLSPEILIGVGLGLVGAGIACLGRLQFNKAPVALDLGI